MLWSDMRPTKTSISYPGVIQKVSAYAANDNIRPLFSIPHRATMDLGREFIIVVFWLSAWYSKTQPFHRIFSAPLYDSRDNCVGGSS